MAWKDDGEKTGEGNGWREEYDWAGQSVLSKTQVLHKNWDLLCVDNIICDHTHRPLHPAHAQPRPPRRPTGPAHPVALEGRLPPPQRILQAPCRAPRRRPRPPAASSPRPRPPLSPLRPTTTPSARPTTRPAPSRPQSRSSASRRPRTTRRPPRQRQYTRSERSPPQHPALGPYAALAPPPHAPHPRALPVRLRLAPPALPHQQRAPEPQVGRRDCLSLHPPRGVCPQRQGPLLHGLSLHRDDQERSARPRRVRAPHAAACLEFIRSGAGVLARDRLIRVVQRANVPSVGAGSAQSQRRCQPARSAPGPAKDCLPPDVLKQLDQSSPGRAPQCYNTPLLIRSQVEVGPSSFSKIKMLGKGDVGRVYLVREKKRASFTQ